MGQLLRAILTIYCGAGLFMGAVSAQQSEPEPVEAPKTSPAPRPIEEITVVGQQSIARLKLRIYETEDEIYRFFNANNSSDRMDIVCTKRRPTGTHLLKRECEPRFLKNLRVEKTRDGRMGIGVGYSQRDLVGWSAQDFENLQEEMLGLMGENAEFSDKLAELVDLNENYEAHWQVMFNAE